MSERPVELQAILREVRRRWTRRSLLRAAAMGMAAAAVVVLTGWLTTSFVARDGIALLTVAAIVLLTAAFVLVRALTSAAGKPTDHQVARLIEERDGGLDDVLVTAVEYDGRSDASGRMRQALFADASAALDARGLTTSVDAVISRSAVRHAANRAAAAGVALAVVGAGFAPSASRAARVGSAYLFPARVSVEVTPGSTRIRAGQPLTITVRTHGLTGEVVPTVNVAIGEAVSAVPMQAADEPGAFRLTVENVKASFAYNVTAAKAKSGDYAVTVIRPPHVERVDVHYDFPPGLGLEPRTDEDSGDIYGPLGTRVRLAIAADKPIANAALVLDDGTRVPLTANGEALDGGLTIRTDGSYRIALADHDGLESPGDIEYFIRTLEDRPPDVRILRPASDKQVSPLEEVRIEARADDDFGIAAFDLVFQAADGREKTVPLAGKPGGLTAAGLHTLFMEDLKVQPGDFVTYYARARDVSRGRPSAEARSDIFFLEVKPFEEEFVVAQSQQMGMGAGAQSGLESLVEAQKQIIVATWNLDARARRANGAQSKADVKTVSKTQAELRDRARQASAQGMRINDPRVRRRAGAAFGDDPIGKAAEAMARAVSELDKISTSRALPHEMQALNELLRAEAENKRRQVTRSQQAGGGGGQNRGEADLSSLFDQELRKRQQTNYESPNSTEERPEQKSENPLDRIRDLARRQEALNRNQRELMRNRDQMDAEELKRQLERLSREQEQLRQEAQQLAQQSQSGQNQNGANGAPKPGDDGKRLREISEDMRNAATGLQRQDPNQAAQSGDRASERLRDLERSMQASRPDERRRAAGDMQLESRQIADAERRLANESSRTAKGDAGADARRRLAAEQERLAERTDRLQENIRKLSRGGESPDHEQAMSEAARELEKQNLGQRMRDAAESMRQNGGSEGQQQEIARSLDRVSERLGAASGARDADSRRQSDQLARSQELRDKLQDIDRNIEAMKREAQAGEQGQPSSSQPPQSQPQSQPGQGQQASGQPSQGQPSQGQPSPGKSQQGQGTQGGGSGGPGRLEQLQRDVNEQMREAERLAEGMRRDNPAMQANPESNWWRSFSAPGTEAFKQDFARWESLKKHMLVALEDVETKLSDELRARDSQQRLNAGGHETVNEAYRDLVDQYYRSLAAPRRPQ